MRRMFAPVSSLLLMLAMYASPVSAGKLTVVEVISSPARSTLLRAQLQEFSHTHPGSQIELITLPWDGAFERVQQMFASGHLPDVIELPERWSALYIRQGQLEPLDGWLARSSLSLSLQPNALKAARFGTRQTWQLPHSFYLTALFYNRKLLTKAGVSPPQTQSEFVRAVARISRKLPGKYGYCLRGGKGGGYEWISHAMTYGNKDRFFDRQGHSLFATPGFRQGMQMVVDFYRKGYAPKESLHWGYNEVINAFASGQCAFLAQDPDALIPIVQQMGSKDLGVLPMPRGSSGYAYPKMGFAGWALTRAGKNKAESWQLVEFLLSTPKNLEWARLTGILPVQRSASQSPMFSSGHWAGWFRQLSDSEYKPFLPPSHLPEWGALYDQTMVAQGQELLQGKRRVDEVAHEWARILTAAQRHFDARTGRMP